MVATPTMSSFLALNSIGGFLRPFGRDAGELRFALRVGVNTHIQLVRAKCTVRQMDIDSRRVHRLAI